MITQEQILETLNQIQDPDLHQGLVSLGFIKNLKIEGGVVSFDINLTTPACPVKDVMKAEAERRVSALPGVEEVNVNMTAEVRKSPYPSGKSPIPGIRNIVAIGSGKGGVGKSAVTTNIACGFVKRGARVGILDADIYGPSVPIMMGVNKEKVRINKDKKILPAESHGVKIMSMGFLAEGDQPLIWRGPMAHKALQQCLFDVAWGELDYLFVDLPPGTGDVHLTLSESIALAGAVIVSTPQDVGLMISRKTLRMFQKTQVRILGLLENMSYHICSKCQSREEIFGSGTVKNSAKELDLPYLGEIPLDVRIRKASDNGIPLVLQEPKTELHKAYEDIIGHLAQEVSIASYNEPTPYRETWK